MTKEDIKNLLVERQGLYDINEEDKRVDEIGDIILKYITFNSDEFEVDFIIETWTHLGYALNVIYDDNGLFAVSGDGFQPVVTGDERIEGAITTIVAKEQWKPTIREALIYYLLND